MDTHLSNNIEGLEFLSLKEVTPNELLQHYARSRIVVEMAKGFSILVSAENTNKDLKWVNTQIGEA